MSDVLGLEEASADGVTRILELARRHLDMEFAYLAEFRGDRQVHRGFAGDHASFGALLDDGPPLEETYCARMAAGEIANAIPDARRHPVVGSLALTERAGIGSYVGVPVRYPDGALYGSLCVLSHSTREVDARDAKFLTLLADVVANQLEAQREVDCVRLQFGRLLADEHVAIALQPIVDVTTGRMLGVEALSRFPPEFGPPDHCFAEAHRVGLGGDLEQLAIRSAVALLPRLGPGQYLTLNASPEAALELAELTERWVEVPLDRLVLEITEHASVDNYTALRAGLASVRRRGLRLAIDDAGAGYASLHHIVELAPDIIKVDRSLIDGLADDPARRSVVTAFAALAHDLDARVVAEGVERAVDLRTARFLGVDAAQGYLLARPSTSREDLARWTSATFPVGGEPMDTAAASSR